MAAVVATILALQNLHATDLEEAGKNGQDVMRVIRAANIIKRFFRAKSIRTRLNHRLLTERVKFDADLLRGLGRLLVQICLFCFLISVTTAHLHTHEHVYMSKSERVLVLPLGMLCIYI